MRFIVRRLAGVAKGLIKATIIQDDRGFVEDRLALPLLGDWQLAGRPGRPDWAPQRGLVLFSASKPSMYSRSASIALRISFVVQFAHCSALVAASPSKGRDDGSLYPMSVSMTEPASLMRLILPPKAGQTINRPSAHLSFPFLEWLVLTISHHRGHRSP